MQSIASCLGAADPALSASAAAALGIVSLQAPLPLPLGDLEIDAGYVCTILLP